MRMDLVSGTDAFTKDLSESPGPPTRWEHSRTHACEPESTTAVDTGRQNLTCKMVWNKFSLGVRPTSGYFVIAATVGLMQIIILDLQGFWDWEQGRVRFHTIVVWYQHMLWAYVVRSGFSRGVEQIKWICVYTSYTYMHTYICIYTPRICPFSSLSYPILYIWHLVFMVCYTIVWSLDKNRELGTYSQPSNLWDNKAQATFLTVLKFKAVIQSEVSYLSFSDS